MKPTTLAKQFKFLDELRESGVTNMYGAAPYLMEAFGMNRDGASIVVVQWMKTFDRGVSAMERATKALQS